MGKIELELELQWKYKNCPPPYNWMVNDLYRGIQAQENYLVALGLFVYSEALGRVILGTVGHSGGGCEAFREFTEKYVGYSFEGGEWKNIFNDCRNGLAHQYFVKNKIGSILNEDGSRTCGIEMGKNNIMNIYINSYFNSFVKGLEKYLDENPQV